MTLNEQHLSEDDLTAFIDGKMEPADAVLAETHIAACSTCAAVIAEGRQLSVEMRQWAIEEPSERLTANVLAELQTTPPRQRSMLRSILSFRLGKWEYAAVGIAALILGFIGYASISNLPSMRLMSEESAKPGYAAKVAMDAPSAAEPAADTYFDKSSWSSAGRGQRPSEGQQGQNGAGQRGAGFDNAGVPLKRAKTELQSYLTQAGTISALAVGGKAEPAPQPASESSGPMVIRTARLAIVTKDAKEFDAARAQIETIIRETKGYIDQLNVNGNKGEGRSLSAKLRIPANRMDEGLNKLRTLGKSDTESQNAADITSQFVDLTARMTNSRNTEQRLITLLRERTGNLKDILEVEQQIARVREEIERMEAERKSMMLQVAYSTIQVDLSETYHAKIEETVIPSSGTRLQNAGVRGYEHLRDTVLGFLTFLLEFGPTLLLLAAVLLAPVGMVVWKVRKQRQAEAN